jgi:hypothetical protein
MALDDYSRPVYLGIYRWMIQWNVTSHERCHSRYGTQSYQVRKAMIIIYLFIYTQYVSIFNMQNGGFIGGAKNLD